MNIEALKNTYNRIAGDWSEDHKNDIWWTEGTEKFISYFKPGQTILDVGCASGLKTEFITKKGLQCVGIDLSDNMIALAKQRMPAGHFLVKDIMQPLDLDREFDGVFAQAVLLHIPKDSIRKVLKNLYNVLKSKGYLYIAVKEIWKGHPDEEVVKENDYGYDYERFFSYFSEDEVKNYFQDLKMNIVFNDIVSSGKTNWIQVIAQKV